MDEKPQNNSRRHTIHIRKRRPSNKHNIQLPMRTTRKKRREIPLQSMEQRKTKLLLHIPRPHILQHTNMEQRKNTKRTRRHKKNMHRTKKNNSRRRNQNDKKTQRNNMRENQIRGTKNQIRGMNAEYHVIKELQKQGMEVKHTKTWYDIQIKEEKIEIKSSCISVKSTGRTKRKTSWEYGRFDFQNKKNREKIWKNNIWLCFVIRWKKRFMILGFIQAQKLPQRRYFKISQLRDKKLIETNQLCEKINKVEK